MALDARVDEHPGGMSQGGALSELETSVLQVEQRATERVAILRVLNGLLHRSFGDGRCGDDVGISTGPVTLLQHTLEHFPVGGRGSCGLSRRSFGT